MQLIYNLTVGEGFNSSAIPEKKVKPLLEAKYCSYQFDNGFVSLTSFHTPAEISQVRLN